MSVNNSLLVGLQITSSEKGHFRVAPTDVAQFFPLCENLHSVYAADLGCRCPSDPLIGPNLLVRFIDP